MINSFYNSAAGIKSSQSHFDIIANNIANISTQGYKKQTASFADLVYTQIGKNEGGSNLISGSGSKIEYTGVSKERGIMIETEGSLDFAIDGEGFFLINDPKSGENFLTRSGSFTLSRGQDEKFYLCTPGGEFVLDRNHNRIAADNADQSLDMGVFNVQNSDGLELLGTNLYKETLASGQIYLQQEPNIKRGYIEGSNVDLSYEMAKIIECQAAYRLSSKMLQTSDEIIQTIQSIT